MAKLIARLYEPDGGQIRLDGHPLESLDTEWLRENITLVPPEPVMFSGTVSDNIRFGRPDATLEEVEAAARLAYADEFIQELPERYETAVGESGRLFSSGQRQRIALARAILRRPQVLILDESTAALDTQTESAVKESLRKLPNHPTLILISHRLSTIADAKRVIVLNDGKIVAEGTHNVLLEDSEFYRELVKDQLLID
jgi:ATP-binding cassette subfamily B protein